MKSADPTPRRGLNAGVLTALAIAVAAAAGYFVQERIAAPEVTTAPTTPPPIAEASAPAAAESAALKVPETLPQFELKDSDGKPRKLGEWKGRPLAVNFWATWCVPCVREIPLLVKLRQERKEQKLEIIGIAVDFRDDVLKFAAEHGLDYPLLIGEEDGLAAVTAVGMQPAFPFTVFADSQQRIVALKVGELHHEEATLILDTVAEVESGKLELEAARTRIAEGLKDLATLRAQDPPK
jgi:thiol-disulfide isomerase/thioredoxin